MRSLEAFIIGLAFGFLLGWSIVVSRETPSADAVPPRVAARDTASCACCEEYLDHVATEHPKFAGDR